MNREQEIRNEIQKLEDMYDKRKWNLTLKTWAILSTVFCVAAFCFGWMHEPLDFLAGVVISAVASGLFLFVSVIVMTPLLILRGTEVETLTRLRTELDMIEKGILRNDDTEQ